jgi:hypothetical protein
LTKAFNVAAKCQANKHLRPIKIEKEWMCICLFHDGATYCVKYPISINKSGSLLFIYISVYSMWRSG